MFIQLSLILKLQIIDVENSALEGTGWEVGIHKVGGILILWFIALIVRTKWLVTVLPGQIDFSSHHSKSSDRQKETFVIFQIKTGRDKADYSLIIVENGKTN